MTTPLIAVELEVVDSWVAGIVSRGWTKADALKFVIEEVRGSISVANSYGITTHIEAYEAYIEHLTKQLDLTN